MSKSGAALAIDPASVWLSKEAAAARLAVSARTVERWIEEGKLQSRLQRQAGRKPRVVIDPASIQAAVDEGRTPAAAAAALPALRVPEGLAQLLQRIAPAAPVKPWLTLEEAAEYSGLPRGWLLSQARGGSAIALDVGMAGRSAWRFSRSRLAKLSRSV